MLGKLFMDIYFKKVNEHQPNTTIYQPTDLASEQLPPHTEKTLHLLRHNAR